MKAAAERDYSHYIAVADKTREEEEKPRGGEMGNETRKWFL